MKNTQDNTHDNIVVKTIELLGTVNHKDPLVKEKVELIGKMLSQPYAGLILNPKLVDWAKENKLHVEGICDSGGGWWSVRLINN